MIRKNVLHVFLWAVSLALLSTGCGGSSGSKSVDLTITVPTTVSQKKGKLHKLVSLKKVKGTLLADGTEVEGTEENGVFTVKVPEASDVHLVATVTNENGSEFDFESFVDNATTSDQTVDEDSTRVASLLINEGVSNGTSIKDLLEEQKEILEELKQLLESFDGHDSLNDVLATATANETLDSIRARIEDAVEKLKEYRKILAHLEERLSQFENSTEAVSIKELDEDDIKGAKNEDSDDEFLNEFFVRPTNLEHLASGRPDKEHDCDIFLNADGTISVERGEDSSSTGEIHSKDRLSGLFVSAGVDSLTIKVKHEGVAVNIDFSFSAELTALVASFQVDDRLAVTYTEADGINTLIAIYAEGYLSGTLTALTDTVVTLTLTDGTVVELPIISRIRSLSDSKTQKNRQTIETTTASEVETNDESEDTNDESEEEDHDVLSELEDHDRFNLVKTVAIGDVVVVHWRVRDNVKIVLGVFGKTIESSEDEDEVESEDSTSETIEETNATRISDVANQ